MLKNPQFILWSLVVGGLAFVYVPHFLAFLAWIIFILTVFLLFLQTHPLLAKIQKVPRFLRFKTQPFVSIHIPITDEPPAVVEKTLRSVKQLNYRNYEVIVLDNNTQDQKKLSAIRRICKRLGRRFKFYHVDRLKGFKAGALNLMLRLASPKAEFIAILDADYIVKSGFLKKSLKPFGDEKVVMVQCPQDYRNVGIPNQGIIYEYASFFSLYMNEANAFGSVLFTGTMGIIRKKVFAQIGLWNEHCVTEDSELGLRLQLAGQKTIYIHESFGHGFLPIDVRSYYLQRYRWAYGNTQVLKANLWRLMTSPLLSFQKKLSCLSQLTAWINFLYINVLFIFLGLAGAAFLGLNRAQEHLLWVSVASLVLALLGKLVFFLGGLTIKYHIPIRISFRSLLTHINLMWVSSLAFFSCLFNVREGFKRTNKDPLVTNKVSLQEVTAEIIYGTGFLVLTLAAGLLYPQPFLFFVSGTLLSLVFFLNIYIRYQINATWQITKTGL